MLSNGLQIDGLKRGYADSAFTPEDVVREILARCDAYPDPAVWISRVPPDEIFRRARALQQSDMLAMPLYGIPFAVKDNIDVAGMPTTAACPGYAYTPERSAQVVERLLAAGAILIGKTNLDQFATGLVGMRSPYGAPSCVFDDRYISGGSSSGSGVAVGADLVSFALGTDTAGSGRVPASFNNVVGVKPTCGTLSTTGLVPACRSLDCISIFAGTTGDAMIVLRCVAAFDPDDPYSRPMTPRTIPLDALKVGILAEDDRDFCGDTEAAALYREAIERIRNLGARIVEIDYTPFLEVAQSLYGGARKAERLVEIRGFAAQHASEMDPTVRGIVQDAASVTGAELVRAEYQLQKLKRTATAQWAAMDVLLLPTCPTIFTRASVEAEPIRLNSLLGTYTNFVNLLDLSAIAVPAGFRPSNGLPFGVTLIGPAFSDHALAIVADRMHRASGSGIGKHRYMPDPKSALTAEDMPAGIIHLAVAGAHLSGMPLNRELIAQNAMLLRKCRTAAGYRLYALPNTSPPKPGLVRAPGFAGPGIEIEVWALTEAAFGAFVANVPAPMGIGKLELEDGSTVNGFLCEPYALERAQDITALTSWRRYIEQLSTKASTESALAK